MQADFILIDDYQSELDSKQWQEWIENKNFDFRLNRAIFEEVKLKVFAGLHQLPNTARRDAWTLLLNLD